MAKNVLKGDLGYSLVNHRPVAIQIIERLPATIGLMLTSLVFSNDFGIVIGLFSAANHNKFFDKLITIGSYFGISIPSFWFAMMLVYIFISKIEFVTKHWYENNRSSYYLGLNKAWNHANFSIKYTKYSSSC